MCFLLLLMIVLYFNEVVMSIQHPDSVDKVRTILLV